MAGEPGAVKINNPLFAKCIICLETDEGVRSIKAKCDCVFQCHYSCYENFINKNPSICPLCKNKKTAEEDFCLTYCFCCFLFVGLLQ